MRKVDAFLPMRSPEAGCFAQAHTEPETITLFWGWTRLTTDNHGEMRGGPLEGFFSEETLFVSKYGLLVDGRPLSHRFSAQLSPTQWTSMSVVSGTVETGQPKEGALPRGSLEVRILREIEHDWMEEIRVVNHSPRSRKVRCEAFIICPVGDRELSEEMKRDSARIHRGVLPKIKWNAGAPTLRFRRHLGRRSRTPTLELQRITQEDMVHNGDPVTRAVTLRIGTDPCVRRITVRKPLLKRGRVRVRFEMTLPPRGTARIQMHWSPEIGRFVTSPRRAGPKKPVPGQQAALRFASLSVESANSTFNLILSQAVLDLSSLRLPLARGERSRGTEDPSWDGIIAGIPRYIGVFSRDTVITAWQSALLAPGLTEPALTRIAAYRGVRRDDWRDEELWRLPHERRLGPNAAMGKTNRALYYGDVTAGAFWIIALATAFKWSGDLDLLKRQAAALEDCCSWLTWRLEQGGGYIYYAPAIPESKQANLNQGWKDSGDAIVDPEGKIRHPPLAVAEIQSNAYLALRMAAELHEIMGREGGGLRRAAEELRRRFSHDFWIPQENFVALALDKERKQVATIASNAGHCLFSGILSDSRARSVVERLLSPELFSGWGIRTLSSKNPSYDPFSYHRGSVWPVENATIAYGMSRLGFKNEALRIIGAQLRVASLFPHMRLPEVFSGHERSADAPTPGLYPYANLLQAWSVSAISLHLQTMLGIEPDAQARTLWVDPALPEWLPRVEVRGLRLGAATLDLAFWREPSGETQVRVERKIGPVAVKRRESYESDRRDYRSLGRSG